MTHHIPTMMLAAGCACLLGAGCASTTPRVSLAQPVSEAGRSKRAAASYAGLYIGTWQSDSGHHGKLTCQFTPAGATHYHAHFTAWWLTFHTSYDTLFSTARQDAALTFAGEQDLGILRGGRYHYQGLITHGQWQARYRAASDRGTFTMARE